MNQTDYTTMLHEIDEIWDATPSTPEGDRLLELVALVEAYEAEHYPVARPSPIARAMYYLESRGLLHASQELDYWIVHDDEFLRYALGDTETGAWEAYQEILWDYYKDLCEMKDRLAPNLARDLVKLKSLMGLGKQA